MLKLLAQKLSLVFIIVISMTSCSFKKDVIYFQNPSYSKQNIVYPSISIQPNDILSVTISALVPETAILYNKLAPGKTEQVLTGTTIDLMRLNGYLVDLNGDIDLPILGKINTSGLTIQDLKDSILKKLIEENHLVKPSVMIRLLNAKVTILGEVNKPGTYMFTEQLISVPQAIGYAGDLTISGKRNDILLIRDENGKRRNYRIDLTQSSFLRSKVYYLKPNDILVVSPNNAKVKSAGYLGSVSSLIGVISLIITTTVLLTN